MQRGRASDLKFDPATWIDCKTGDARDGAAFGAIFSAQAQISPERAAFTIDGKTTCFGELDRGANRMARRLADAGLGRGDRIAIVTPNGLPFIVAVVASWKIGAVPAPVPASLLQAERNYILALLEPAAVLAADETIAAPCPVLGATLCDADAWSGDPMPPVIAPAMKILCSGGSTGTPKLIVDPCPAVWGPDKRGYRREEASVLSIPGPFHHTSPFMNIFCGMAQGTHVIATSRFDPVRWLDDVERYRVDQAWLVPTMMGRIANLPEEVLAGRVLSSIEMLVHVAAPCPHSVKRWWIDRLGADKVWEIYGGTERIGATFIGGAEWLERPGSVGRPGPGTEIVIRDADGAILPSGEIGEIWFSRRSGDGAPAYEYVGAASRVSDGMDSFGDCGWLDEEGFLFIADRRTDMFTVGGSNVYPAEIENAITGLTGVASCAVIGLPDDDLGNRIHAIIELLPGSAPDPARFMAAIGAVLPPSRRPGSIEFTTSPLRDEAGKIRRSRLREERLPNRAAKSAQGTERING